MKKKIILTAFAVLLAFFMIFMFVNKLNRNKTVNTIEEVELSNVLENKQEEAPEEEEIIEKEIDTRFKIIGYMPDWYDESVIDDVQIEKYTHINYAFAIPDEEGNIREFDNPDFAKKLIETCHNNNIKVILSVGGWSYLDVPLQATFEKATETEEKTAFLADNIISVMNEYGFDGVDIDWEYPTANTKVQYDNLITDLYNYLSKKNKLLTSAVAYGDGMSDEALSMMDWVNVMAYDGDQGAGHSPMTLSVSMLDYWIRQRGVPMEKVNLGLPFYERPNWSSYEYIVLVDPENAYNDRATINGKTVYYNGLSTIMTKTAYARVNAGGVMIWEITQDSKDPELSLLNAIVKVLDAYDNKESASEPASNATDSAE